jgi:hypothetical protein
LDQQRNQPKASEAILMTRGPVRTFRMTISSFHYDESRRQLLEYESYFKIDRRARDVAEIARIRTALEQKGRRHFSYWLLKHLNVRLDRRVQVNFEKEQRAKRQVEQARASVHRLLMRRVNKRWEAQELPPGTMRFVKRRSKRAKKQVGTTDATIED